MMRPRHSHSEPHRGRGGSRQHAAAPAGALLSTEELIAFAQPDESAASLFERCHADPLRTGVPFIDAWGGVRPGIGLEILGPSGTLKTEILIQAAATCILPKEKAGVGYGGNEGHVVFLDLDSRMDPLRLFQVIDGRINQARRVRGLQDSSEAPEEVQAIFDDSLARFHLVRCNDSLELLAALHSLPKFVESEACGGPLRMLLIDGLSAHYWMDRAVTLPPGPRDQQGPGAGCALTLSSVHAAASAMVKAFLRCHRTLLIATKWTTLAWQGGSGGAGDDQSNPQPQSPWQQRDYVPSCWQSVFSQRLLLAPSKQQQQQQHHRSPASASRLVLAKWQAPARDLIPRFCIVNDELLCHEV